MSARVLLVTAFTPFGGDRVNPAAQAVALLPRQIGGCRIETLLLPVTYDGCFPPVAAAMEALRPAAVVCIGQASGRDAITPERIAINLDDAAAPDNAGVIRTDTPITPDAPAACFATLPVKGMCEAISHAGVPARVSLSAGAYVCNHLFYLLMRRLSETKSACLGGFVHVPALPEQTSGRPDIPSLPLATIVTGLTAGLAAVAGSL